MAKIKEKFPATFTEFVKLIEEFQGKSEHSLWYRGIGRADYKLLPTLYRHKTLRKIDELAQLEGRLMTRFRQRSIPFHNRSLVDDWDLLFFMQHYGAPTRLLDWTENPFIGLFFAVMSASFKIGAAGKPRFAADGAVWVLNPVLWNRQSLKHQSYEGGVLTPGEDAVKGYKPTPSFSGMYNHPVALYGAHNSPRIVAQRGVFTVFGQDTKPMEVVCDKQNFPPDCLVKIVLKQATLATFRKSILNHGVTESVVVPDLDGLAKEMRREFGFEVK
jgi:FRG domain